MTDDKKYKGFSTLVHEMDRETLSYFTAYAIKRDETFIEPTSKINLGRFSGYVIGPCGAVPVYINPHHKNAIHASTEIAALRVIRSTARRNGASYPNMCFVLVDSEENFFRAIDERLDSLSEVFSSVVVIPITDTKAFKESDGEYIINLYGTESAAEKIKSSLYYSEERRKKSDGEIDGLPSWELITSDFSKLKDIRRCERAHVICYAWQKDIIDRLTPNTDIEYMVLSDNKLEELKNLIKEV